MRVAVMDTETTGLNEPDVIQIAFLMLEKFYVPPADPVLIRNYRPTKPIEIGALATHHIIEEDLTGCPVWPGQFEYWPELEYAIGHQIDFDAKVSKLPERVRRICTLSLARYAWPNLPTHSLSALIYHIYPQREARELVMGAHQAATDVQLCYRVLRAILNSIGQQVHDFEHLWQISETARVPKRFWFGKYGPKDGKPGQLISEVVSTREGLNYLDWVRNNVKDLDIYQRRALGFE